MLIIDNDYSSVDLDVDNDYSDDHDVDNYSDDNDNDNYSDDLDVDHDCYPGVEIVGRLAAQGVDEEILKALVFIHGAAQV